jgi:hypothetical protein
MASSNESAGTCFLLNLLHLELGFAMERVLILSYLSRPFIESARSEAGYIRFHKFVSLANIEVN